FALARSRNARQFRPQIGFPYGDLKRVLPYHLEAPFENDREREVAVLELASKRLIRLIRYERRAANMRDKALRELERMKADKELTYGGSL
ncbi:MAG: hypothetical protein IIB38_13745, partial [Candidatus Hydrogenedentes bacterium]|nr:hypothetical protein [Candidatus Hydrogenedentota bacterium]